MRFCFVVLLPCLFFACATAEYELPTPRDDWESHTLHNWKDFSATESKDGYVGNNTEIFGCDDYPGTRDLLLDDLSLSVKDGLKCLNRLGPVRRKDASKLAAFFDTRISQRPVKIFCGKKGEKINAKTRFNDPYVIGSDVAGRSLDPDSPDFPGFFIRLFNEHTSKDYRERRVLLFHEMLHWLGYMHGVTYEVPYLATECCFSKAYPSEPDLKSPACQLLSNPEQFPSEIYFKKLARAMTTEQTRRQVVGQAMYMAMAKQNAGLLMAVVRELYSGDDGSLTGAVFGKSALFGARESEKQRLLKEWEDSGLKKYVIPDLVDRLATFFGNAIMNGYISMSDTYSVTRLLTEYCPKVSSDTRMQIEYIGEISFYPDLISCTRTY